MDSGRGQPIEVVKQRPFPPKLLNPSDGAKGVSTTTAFTWTDPGAQTDRKADTFDIAIFQGGSQVDAVSGLPSTTYAIATGKLKIGMSTSWSVQGRNSSGLGGQSQATFTTVAPKPILSSYDQTSQKLKASNFPPTTKFTLKFQYLIDAELYFDNMPFVNDDRAGGTVTGTWISDSAGNFDNTVDLYTATPQMPYSKIDHSNSGGAHTGVIKGPLNGERVILRAEYYTNSLGWIQSDPLTFTWQKETVRG